MEVRPCIGEADGLAVLLAVGEDQDVRMLRVMELVDDMRLRSAELPREVEEFSRAQALRANDQELRGEERVPDLAKRPRHALDFRAEAAEFSDVHTKGSEQFFRYEYSRKIAPAIFRV